MGAGRKAAASINEYLETGRMGVRRPALSVNRRPASIGSTRDAAALLEQLVPQAAA